MHRRSLIIIAIVAILAVAGGTFGIVQARAQGEPSLATTTPAELLANVARHSGDVSSLKGDVTWENNLLGLSMLSFGGQGTGDLASLLASGTGRVWMQDGKARFEIKGAVGDTTLTGDSSTGKLWVYSSGDNTATEYTLPAMPGDATDAAELSTPTSIADPVAAIEQYIEKMAPDATLALGDPVKVAGRDCYVLSLTPKASNTVFGSAQVAIDSDTYVPLRLDVYAKGIEKPVLTAGFTSVSYSSIAADIFDFTPPPGATVERKEFALPELDENTPSDEAAAAERSKDPLTIAEAATQAGFTPLAASPDDASLAFVGARVIPAQEVDLGLLLDEFAGGMAETSESKPGADALTVPPALFALPSGPMTLGPTVIQRYGEGFGTVILVETNLPAEMLTQLEQILGFVPFVARSTEGPYAVYQLSTALGSVALWSNDGHLLMAEGMVSQTALKEFIAGVR